MKLDTFLTKCGNNPVTVELGPVNEIKVDGVSCGKDIERSIQFRCSNGTTWNGKLLDGEVLEETRPPRKR